MSRPHLIALAAAVALAGCAGSPAPSAKLAVCDGKHRRPANLNGSVLALTPTAPVQAAAAAAPVRASSRKAPKSTRVSAVSGRREPFPSC